MANVKFSVRRPKAKTKQPIYINYRFGRNEKLVYPTGLKVHPNHWNQKGQKVRETTDEPAKDEINNFLNQIRTDIEKEISKLKTQKKPISKEGLKRILDEYLNPKEKSEVNSFHGFFNEFLKNAIKRINSKTGTPVVYTTVRKYHQCYNAILEYEQAKKIKLTWNDINMDFYHNFIEFLQSKNQTVNNIGKHIKTLKVVLNEATDKKINTNMAYKSHHFKSISEKSEAVYLNEDELNDILHLDLSKNKRLEKVRDYFIIGCYTALRLSDLKTIVDTDIVEYDGKQYFQKKQKKTNEPVLIPIHPIVKSILNKYKNKLPEPISDQRFNNYIKEVAKMAGINKITTRTQRKGAKVITETQPKYKFIASHTARRSFCTNMYLRGYDVLTIRAISGHKSDRAFYDYIKITPKQRAAKMYEMWAKDGDLMKVV